jgi:TusA-related sulfurtransferase
MGSDAIKKLNVKGMVCPEPAVATRDELRKMTAGQLLEVEGDCDPAVENITNIAKKNHAEVIQSDTKRNYFKLLIKKQP